MDASVKHTGGRGKRGFDCGRGVGGVVGRVEGGVVVGQAEGGWGGSVDREGVATSQGGR